MVRQLARPCSSRARAYRALEEEGLVRADGRAGTTVLDIGAGDESAVAARVAEATRRYLAELERLGVTGQDALDAVRRGVAPT